MGELIEKLGIDTGLLLAQAVNFLVLLWLLRKFVYVPLLKAMKERRGRIEEGLVKAEEADQRLVEANELAKDKLRETEQEAMSILRMTEERAKKTETQMLAEARGKEAQMLENAERAAAAKEAEAAQRFQAEAGELLRAALVKAVGIHPDKVDEALVESAVKEIKKA